jgi:hypothetical protein
MDCNVKDIIHVISQFYCRRKFPVFEHEALSGMERSTVMLYEEILHGQCSETYIMQLLSDNNRDNVNSLATEG